MMNVVLVTVDSLRADHMGCYGYDRDTTPNVDALESEGVAIDAYANANATRASFPAILTSTYPLAYGGFEYLSEQRTMVSTPLSEAGYATGGFHSNVWLSADFNYDRGFDTFYDSKSEPSLFARLRSYLKTSLDQDGHLYRTLQTLYDQTERQAGLNVGKTYKDAETITDRALSWVDGQESPFFLWVHYMDVHHPYVPRPEAAGEMGLDLGVSDREAVQLREKMLSRPEAVTDTERDQLVALYDAEIRYADRHIGRLVDAVDGMTEETAVVFTADHGEEFGEHGGFSHNPSMYEEIVAVPMVLSGAGIEASDRPEIEAQLLDVGPTVLDLAGVEVPEHYEGRSVLDRIDAGASPAVISETTSEEGFRMAVRNGGWKYIWDDGQGIEELYDLSVDPGEHTDVVDEERGKRDSLRSLLEDHLSAVAQTNEDLPDVQMDAETETRLKDLGYLE